MYGHYSRNFDDKHRVVIPPKLKKELGSIFYATVGPDKVLELRDEKSFAIWRDKLLSTNLLNANARKFARVLLGNTIEVIPDKQGRMSIPDSFINLTSLTKEIVFVGIGNKVEIWPKEAFNNFQKEFNNDNSLDQLAKKLLDDGIDL